MYCDEYHFHQSLPETSLHVTMRVAQDGSIPYSTKKNLSLSVFLIGDFATLQISGGGE
jgi:hypothetical protein